MTMESSMVHPALLEPSANSEPRSRRLVRSPRFLIGKDRRGNWVVQDRAGLCGGLFVDRAEALRFAMRENGGRPQAVIMVPGTLELSVGPPAAPDIAVISVRRPHPIAAAKVA